MVKNGRKAPKQRNRGHDDESGTHEMEAAEALLVLGQTSNDNSLDQNTQTDIDWNKVDKATQATPPTLLSANIENIILKNQSKHTTKKDSNGDGFSFETCAEDPRKFKFYTGFQVQHFLALWTFLGNITDKLSYWGRKRKFEEKSPSKRSGPSRKLSPKTQLFLTLIRLRRGFSNRDLGYRFQISETYVSYIVITWVQLMYQEFKSISNSMFPTCHEMREHISPAFKKFKNLRVIVDCTEFFVQMPQNFVKQGNLFSSYKHHHTYKVLIGLSPTGAISYISEGFEGGKSDKEVFLQCGIMEYLDRGDSVMADRGFTIKSELSVIGVDLNMPPFLMGRDRLTPQEEIKTKRIAKARIHVERVIERIKTYKLLKRTLPHSLGPLFNQIVYVVGCLVNFQKPIC